MLDFRQKASNLTFARLEILIERDHVLLHKQREDHYWALPGGGIELGERSKDAVVREFEEELGCIRVIGVSIYFKICTFLEGKESP